VMIGAPSIIAWAITPPSLLIRDDFDGQHFITGKVLRAPFLPRRLRPPKLSGKRSRAALLESPVRALSRYGYGNLVLEQVAREAGYTFGALYHQFRDKEELALAVLDWVNQTWWREVGTPAEQEPDPVAALLALARGHAVYCRRDVAASCWRCGSSSAVRTIRWGARSRGPHER
jgi:AcrR family transcriptional regulator